MKRPIKFRGYDTADGVRVWVTFTLDELLSGVDYYEHVDPDTIVQLVGYDANGREVYEGDILVGVTDPAKPPMNEYTVEFKVHGYKHGACVTFEARISDDVLKEVKK